MSDEDLLDCLLNVEEELEQVNEVKVSEGKKFSTSNIHTGDTDSSDDEDNRDFQNSKYNDFGKSIKQMFHSNENDRSIERPQRVLQPGTWKSKPNADNISSTAASLNQNKSGGDIYTDPIFGIRIINPVISHAMLKERMQGREAVTMGKVRMFVERLTPQKDWVVAGVIVHKMGKTSQKGNMFAIWTLSDLHGDLKTVTLFLFGSAYKELSKCMTGTVVGVLNPTVFEKKKDSKDEACLSVDNYQKVMIFGQSKDLATCKSMKKSGEMCMAFVNKNRCEFCIYHIKQEYQKCSKRSELQSNFQGKGLTALRNKVLGKNEVFYAGKSFMAIPAKKSQKLAKQDEGRLSLLSGLNKSSNNIVKAKNVIGAKRKQAVSVELGTLQRAKDMELLKRLGGGGSKDKDDKDADFEVGKDKDAADNSKLKDEGLKRSAEEISAEESKKNALAVIAKLKAKKAEEAKKLLIPKNVLNLDRNKLSNLKGPKCVDLDLNSTKSDFNSLANKLNPRLKETESNSNAIISNGATKNLKETISVDLDLNFAKTESNSNAIKSNGAIKNLKETKNVDLDLNFAKTKSNSFTEKLNGGIKNLNKGKNIDLDFPKNKSNSSNNTYLDFAKNELNSNKNTDLDFAKNESNLNKNIDLDFAKNESNSNKNIDLDFAKNESNSNKNIDLDCTKDESNSNKNLSEAQSLDLDKVCKVNSSRPVVEHIKISGNPDLKNSYSKNLDSKFDVKNSVNKINRVDSCKDDFENSNKEIENEEKIDYANILDEHNFSDIEFDFSDDDLNNSISSNKSKNSNSKNKPTLKNDENADVRKSFVVGNKLENSISSTSKEQYSKILTVNKNIPENKIMDVPKINVNEKEANTNSSAQVSNEKEAGFLTDDKIGINSSPRVSNKRVAHNKLKINSSPQISNEKQANKIKSKTNSSLHTSRNKTNEVKRNTAECRTNSSPRVSHNKTNEVKRNTTANRTKTNSSPLVSHNKTNEVKINIAENQTKTNSTQQISQHKRNKAMDQTKINSSPQISYNKINDMNVADTNSSPLISQNQINSSLNDYKKRFPNLTGAPSLTNPTNSMIDLSASFPKKADRAKLTALQWVQKNGTIKKDEGKNKRKRAFDIAAKIELESDPKKQKIQENEFFSDRFKKMMSVTSKHTDLVEQRDDEEQEKYFNKLEMKERMEDKMMSTYKIDCKAVRCLQCKYTSFSAADLCKEQRHRLKVFDAVKRFFKCGDCGYRTVTLKIIPVESCKHCGSGKWERTTMMREKKVEKMHSLSIRGGEQANVNSVITDANVNLLVPDE